LRELLDEAAVSHDYDVDFTGWAAVTHISVVLLVGAL